MEPVVDTTEDPAYVEQVTITDWLAAVLRPCSTFARTSLFAKNATKLEFVEKGIITN